MKTHFGNLKRVILIFAILLTVLIVPVKSYGQNGFTLVNQPETIWYGSIRSSATNITIPRGKVESQSLTVTRTAGISAAVTADIATPLFTLRATHIGYALVKSTTLSWKFYYH